MAYPQLARALFERLTSDEWKIVSYYILKADEYGNNGDDRTAREALRDAIAVAAAAGESNAAGKIQYFLRFY